MAMKIKLTLIEKKIYQTIFKIFHTSSIVSDDETPTTAVKTSIAVCGIVFIHKLNLKATSLSTNNTGVLLVISNDIKQLMGYKPALAGLWRT